MERGHKWNFWGPCSDFPKSQLIVKTLHTRKTKELLTFMKDSLSYRLEDSTIQKQNVCEWDCVCIFVLNEYF